MPLLTPPDSPFNAVNRGVYIADNLDFLRAINTASVDLVCIDPPFAKNDTFIGDRLDPPLSADERENEGRLLSLWGIATPAEADAAGIAWPDDPAARGGYEDTWSWDKDIHEDWVEGIKATHPAVNMLIETARYIHGEDTAAYLCYMAIRLIEIHRVIKATGSLYLHCDHTASSYLRQLLDGVFGRENRRNEFVWQRYAIHSLSAGFDQVSDTVLMYSKGDSPILNRIYGASTDAELEARFPHIEAETGRRYQHVALEQRSNYVEGDTARVIEGQTVTTTVGWRWSQETFDARLKDNPRLIYWTRNGRPRYKIYLDEYAGVPLGNIWTDIPYLAAGDSERTGYPTQKPYRLAERIILASTKPGDVVLDCFAGCAYSAVACEVIRKGDESQARRWVACDLNPRAWTVFKRQFNKDRLVLLKCNDRTTGQQVLGDVPVVTVHGPKELPERSSPITYEVKPLRTPGLRGRRYKRSSTLLSDPEMKEILLRLSDGKAWCCGYESKNADFSLNLGDYELDHIVPKSRGGDDDIINRAPLCPTHNRLKSDHNWTLQELRIEVAYRRELKAGMTPAGLQRLDVALEYAQQERQKAYERKVGRGMGG